MKKNYVIYGVVAIGLIGVFSWFQSHSEMEQIIIKREITQPILQPIQENSLVQKVQTQRNKVVQNIIPQPEPADVEVQVEEILYPEEYNWEGIGNEIVREFGFPVLIDMSFVETIKDGDIFSITLSGEQFVGEVSNYEFDESESIANNGDGKGDIIVRGKSITFNVALKNNDATSGHIELLYDNPFGGKPVGRMKLKGGTDYEVYIGNGNQALYIDEGIHGREFTKMGWTID